MRGPASEQTRDPQAFDDPPRVEADSERESRGDDFPFDMRIFFNNCPRQLLLKFLLLFYTVCMPRCTPAVDVKSAFMLVTTYSRFFACDIVILLV